MALLTSLTALSIDAMLPALTDIGADLGVASGNSSQLIVTTLFAGFAIGQLFYGPISDSVGRKRPIYAGLIIFMVGTILAMVATSFTVMLVGRMLQGFGCAAPRIVTIALVRDQYEGRAMARIMSFVLGVFILVPMLAPAIGQAILLVGSWRMIFAMLLVLAGVVAVWFTIRQPETLEPIDRVDLSLKRIAGAVLEVCRDRSALGYTIASGIVFGSFLGYLNSAQQIFQLQYALGAQFPLYFAVLALSIGCASFANSMLVMRYGMRQLSWLALVGSFLASTVYFVYATNANGMPALWTLMSWGLFTFFCLGLVFGNFNALAIESLGHIAGVAAAVIGSLGTMISLLLGLLIGQAYNGSVLPLVGGFALLSLLSLIAMAITERGTTAS
jgi:DHA1 family bicyclomycin/chloramphenicol resistance-like MFS transporter